MPDTEMNLTSFKPSRSPTLSVSTSHLGVILRPSPGTFGNTGDSFVTTAGGGVTGT